jgi:hypothetical protein
LQFVELTGTKHCHVLDKARKLLNDLGIDSTEFSVEYKDSSGKSNIMIELDRDLALTLAGQYEPKIAYMVAKAFNKPMTPAISAVEARKIAELEPVFKEEAKLYLEHVRTEHKRKMEALNQKFDQEMEMLEIHKQQTIIDKKLTVYADMIASKKVLPNETITYLLQKHQSTIKPSEANYILYREGYLQLNENSGGRYVVTKKGKKFGLSVRQGNTYNTRFFISTFPELLRKIEKSF